MLLICIDVVGRYILNSPLDITIELGEFAMIAIVYPAIAYAQFNKQHVRVELLISRLSKKTQTVLGIFTDALGICLWGLITWQGVVSVIRAWRYYLTTEGLVPLPLYPVQSLIPIGSALLGIQILFSMVGKVKRLFTSESKQSET